MDPSVAQFAAQRRSGSKGRAPPPPPSKAADTLEDEQAKKAVAILIRKSVTRVLAKEAYADGKRASLESRAERALDDALQAKSSEALASAIQQAERISICSSISSPDCKTKLNAARFSLKHVAAEEASLESRAERALDDALQAKSSEALASAVQQAERISISTPDCKTKLNVARFSLKHVAEEEASLESRTERALEDAIQTKSLEALASAVQQAERISISTPDCKTKLNAARFSLEHVKEEIRSQLADGTIRSAIAASHGTGGDGGTEAMTEEGDDEEEEGSSVRYMAERPSVSKLRQLFDRDSTNPSPAAALDAERPEFPSKALLTDAQCFLPAGHNSSLPHDPHRRKPFRGSLPVARTCSKQLVVDPDVHEQVRVFTWSFGRHRGEEDAGAIVQGFKGPLANEMLLQGLRPGDKLVAINGMNVSLLPEADIKQEWHRVQREEDLMHLQFEENLMHLQASGGSSPHM